MKKLIRITTVPISLEKLLEGQLGFMQQYFEVIAISSDKERLEEFGNLNSVNTFHVEMSRAITPIKDLNALFKLYKFLKKEKPSIVHTHTPKAGILGMVAAKLAGVPVRLHTIAGLPLMESYGIKRLILITVEKIAYSCATFVYPNSKGLHQFIIDKNLVAEGKAKVLGNGSSNGIDTEFFNLNFLSLEKVLEMRNSIGLALNDFVYVFVGRIVADKGINELVEAFVDLQVKNSSVSLLLVGPFEQELDPIKETTYNTILNHPKIISVGYQPDVRPFFALSDVLVFPSYREGFPNVVLQAGAMGIPAIVTDINGCNEIIEEGINGILIPVKNKSALIEAMKSLVEEPAFYQYLKDNSRKKISIHYDRNHFWKELLKEYNYWIKSSVACPNNNN